MEGISNSSPQQAGIMSNLKAGNHEVILTSERYTGKAAAENGIASVKTNAHDEHFHRKTAKDGDHVLRAGCQQWSNHWQERNVFVCVVHGKRHQVGQGERSDSYNQRLGDLMVRGPLRARDAAVTVRTRR